ncbi:MAG: DNA gyrase C-terminal beta-propeller domain-containing protein, partial [Candidatus Izemoplasmatales bacterium]
GRNSKGLPIVNLLNLTEGEQLAAVMSVKDFNEGYLFFTTKNGIVKRTRVADFQNIRQNGIRAISLRESDELHSVKLTDGNREILIGASNGKAIRFAEGDVRSMGRSAAGVKGIDLEDGEEVIGVTTIDTERNEVLAITKFGYGKRTIIDEYRLQNRGGKGVKTINVTQKNGSLKKLISVIGDEDLLVVTDKGMIIRVPIDQIAQTKRSTQGVRIINLLEGHQVATIAIVPKWECEEDEICEEITDTNIALEDSGDIIKESTDFSLSEYKQLSDNDTEDDADADTIEDIDDILGDSY